MSPHRFRMPLHRVELSCTPGPLGKAATLPASRCHAILGMEPEASSLAAAIDSDGVRLMSAASILEASVVLAGRHGPLGVQKLDEFVRKAGIDVVPVTLEQAEAGRAGFRRFGKGRHPAGLNFGDCFAYGLATTAKQALLFKGADFARSDVTAAPW